MDQTQPGNCPSVVAKKIQLAEINDAAGILYISRSPLAAWWGKMWFVLPTARWEVGSGGRWKPRALAAAALSYQIPPRFRGTEKHLLQCSLSPLGFYSAYVRWERAKGHRNWYWILGEVMVMLLSRWAQFCALPAGCTLWPPSMEIEWVCPISQEQYKTQLSFMTSSAPKALGAVSDTKASGHLLAFSTFYPSAAQG